MSGINIKKRMLCWALFVFEHFFLGFALLLTIPPVSSEVGKVRYRYTWENALLLALIVFLSRLMAILNNKETKSGALAKILLIVFLGFGVYKRVAWG